MHAARPIIVALVIGLIAVAQQFCCCVLTTMVTSVLAPDHDVPVSGGCCNHAPAAPERASNVRLS